MVHNWDSAHCSGFAKPTRSPHFILVQGVRHGWLSLREVAVVMTETATMAETAKAVKPVMATSFRTAFCRTSTKEGKALSRTAKTVKTDTKGTPPKLNSPNVKINQRAIKISRFSSPELFLLPRFWQSASRKKRWSVNLFLYPGKIKLRRPRASFSRSRPNGSPCVRLGDKDTEQRS